MKTRSDKWVDVLVWCVAIVVTVGVATDPRYSPWGRWWALAVGIYIVGCLLWRRRKRREVKRR
ncbi:MULTISPECIES: hypothetical protein [unclassified Streptomyces]|uniref:hypothetical protein n=1 Tax=unclassified Streptomyces TaxID=2593676 RepID=UPI002E1724AE|nr:MULTISPECIES: hypothetical protein [unclassified Streptomyces]